METKMLRWTAGVTRLDRVRNESIWQRFGVTPIFEKMFEARLRWYGHVLRAKGDTVRETGLNLDVPGRRPRGRPKQRWLDTLHQDLKMAGLHPDRHLIGRNGANIPGKRTPQLSGTNAEEEEEEEEGVPQANLNRCPHKPLQRENGDGWCLQPIPGTWFGFAARVKQSFRSSGS
ncbi:unnamed protein product [Heligmosomoides polygyrus]|uniref:Uncharacterized protein n=1 Tax=Heligmosomoides polygyrus TaxID=6339 RepID=A0A183F7I3_HELPZ|nr:unnamed protein product [Heligmosomoides polygyrus]